MERNFLFSNPIFGVMETNDLFQIILKGVENGMLGLQKGANEEFLIFLEILV